MCNFLTTGPLEDRLTLLESSRGGLPPHELTLYIGYWDTSRQTKKESRFATSSRKISLNALSSQGGSMLGRPLLVGLDVEALVGLAKVDPRRT